MKILYKEGVGFKKEANDHIADNKVKTLGWRYATLEEFKSNIYKKQIAEGKLKPEEVGLTKLEKAKLVRKENRKKIYRKNGL